MKHSSNCPSDSMGLLPTRKLGKNGPQVPAMGFGLMGLSVGYGDAGSDADRFKILDRAYELGERFWDSADIYGDNEELVGKWLQQTGKRDGIFLATKFGMIIDSETWVVNIRSDPEYVKAACAQSLERLGVSHIDLFYCHRVDEKTPIEKTVKAMMELKQEGKIRYLGLSEVSSTTLRRACKIHHIDAVQVEYSPFFLDIEDPNIALLDTCRELGVAVVAYSPLGRGFLTGAIKSPADFDEGDIRKSLPRFSEENFPNNLELVVHLQALAKRKNCTPGQITLAWLLAQGEEVIPIPGTKKIKYLEENLAALQIELSRTEVAEIRKAVENVEMHGFRASPAFSASLFADTPLP